MRILAFDVGLTVGFALLESGKRPIAGSFRIRRQAGDLGGIAMDFEQTASELFAKFKPDAVGRAMWFFGRFSNPISLGPVCGLSMKVDEMAAKRRLPHYTIDEPDARKAFLGHVPRRSKAIKAAIIAECHSRGWWAADDHGCDAQCVGVHILSILEPERSHEATPLFQVTPKRKRARA